MLDLNLSRGKISDFVSFPLFGFTLAIKLRNFDLNAFCQTVSDLVQASLFDRILTLS